MNAKLDRADSTDWKFLGLFGVYLVLFIALVQLPHLRYEPVSRFTAWMAASFWSFFQIPASSAGTNLTFYDFTMEIIFECTGIHYVGIFAAGVLAYPGRGPSRKMLGLLTGIALIVLLNVLRLGLLGMVGHFSPDLFSFLHLYLWHALFTLFVLLLWQLWVKGNIRFSRLPKRESWIALAAAFLSFWIVWANLEHYLAFLAFLADVLFPFMGWIMPMPDAVVVDRDMIGFVSGEYVIYSKTGLYTLNSAVFVALAAAGTLSPPFRLWLKRAAAGAVLMVILHCALLLMDWTLEITEHAVIHSVLRWSIVLSSMVAPVLSWLCALLVFRAKADARQQV